MKSTILAILAIGLLAPLAAGDTITLKNGSLLTGRIEKETGEAVVIRVSGLGTMTVRRSEIRGIVRSVGGPAPTPRPAPVPEPPESAPPGGSTAAPPPPSPTASADAVLGRTVDFRVEAGPVDEALDALSRASGVPIEITKDAFRLMRKQGFRTRGFSREMPLRDWLGSLVDNCCRLEVKWSFGDGGVRVGLAREVKGAEAGSSGFGIEWRDPAGDAKSRFDPRGWQRPDLTSLKLEGRGGFLYVTLGFQQGLEPILGQKTPKGAMKGYELVELYLDVDGDEGTGSEMSWDALRKGWDFRVDVSTGLVLRADHGSTFSQWGNIETTPGVHEVQGTFVTYTLWPQGAGADTTESGDDSPEKRTTMKGRLVVAKIPYRHLGVRPGSVIRACWSDSLEDLLSDDRISKDGTLKLR